MQDPLPARLCFSQVVEHHPRSTGKMAPPSSKDTRLQGDNVTDLNLESPALMRALESLLVDLEVAQEEPDAEARSMLQLFQAQVQAPSGTLLGLSELEISAHLEQ